MLSALVIKDFAIISHVELEFYKGLHVISGETGAGKSIIIDALKMLVGGKVSSEVVRSGAESAIIEGLFYFEGERLSSLHRRLLALGIDFQGEEFVIKRVISSRGRSRCYFGSHLISLSDLQNLMMGVIDISGQHEHVRLLDCSHHLGILDRYAGLEPLYHQYSVCYSVYQSMLEQREEMLKGIEERNRRLDYLDFQIEELNLASLKSGEVDSLELELSRLNSAEQTRCIIGESIERLYDGNGSIIEELGGLSSKLLDVGRHFELLLGIGKEIENARVILEESYYSLRHIGEVESDPRRIDEIQSRLHFLDKLKRKYRMDVESLIGYRLDLIKEREALTSIEERVQELDVEILSKFSELEVLGLELSESRLAASERLSSMVTGSLGALCMKDAQFIVSVERGKELGCKGYDRVEFFLCSNKGEEAKRLSKVASGGELSRVLLAIKRILADQDEVDTYIFDEVDTGLGGESALSVGEALKEVSLSRQVLCITHLASVASYGDHHYRLSKEVVDGRTFSHVKYLDEESRVLEIGRMLGGVITEKTLAHASEMIKGNQGLVR